MADVPGGRDLGLDLEAGTLTEVTPDGTLPITDGGDGAADQMSLPVDPPRTDGPVPPGDMARDMPSPVDLPIDRLPDSGCTGNCQPNTVELQGQSATAFRGTGPGVVLRCPDNQAIIGYEGTQSRSPTYPWLQSVTAHCGRITINGNSATVAAVGKLAAQGGTTAEAWSRLCPANQVMMGFEGWSGSWVGQLSFRCAPLVVSGTSVSLGAVTTLPFTGSRSGSMFATTDCPAGQIAVGQDVAADTWLKGYGAICATPVPVAR